jgi:hypothetical protein
MAITDKILSSIQAEVEVLKETLSEPAPAVEVAAPAPVAPVATPAVSTSGVSPLHNLIVAQAAERLARAPK